MFPADTVGMPERSHLKEDNMSGNEADCTEFYRRRNLPHVEARYLSRGPRVFDQHLSYCGQDYGSKTEITKRGKVIQTLYVLPPIDR